MWQYTKQQQGEEGAPPVALKTRRSLRAVHFHPLGLPLVLTAEVNDVNTPVTLPHGAPTLQEVAAVAETAHEAAHQMPSEPEPARVHFSDAMHQEAEGQHAHHAQRTQPHRRLSEVFRAMMDEEHEEELLAQLESSVNLHTGQSQASASRQILHLAGRPDTQPVFGHASARLPTRHSMDTPVSDLMPFREPRARQPAFHPLAHIEDEDEPSFRVRHLNHRKVFAHMRLAQTPECPSGRYVPGGSSCDNLLLTHLSSLFQVTVCHVSYFSMLANPDKPHCSYHSWGKLCLRR